MLFCLDCLYTSGIEYCRKFFASLHKIHFAVWRFQSATGTSLSLIKERMLWAKEVFHAHLSIGRKRSTWCFLVGAKEEVCFCSLVQGYAGCRGIIVSGWNQRCIQIGQQFCVTFWKMNILLKRDHPPSPIKIRSRFTIQNFFRPPAKKRTKTLSGRMSQLRRK